MYAVWYLRSTKCEEFDIELHRGSGEPGAGHPSGFLDVFADLDPDGASCSQLRLPWRRQLRDERSALVEPDCANCGNQLLEIVVARQSELCAFVNSSVCVLQSSIHEERRCQIR